MQGKDRKLNSLLACGNSRLMNFFFFLMGFSEESIVYTDRTGKKKQCKKEP